MGAIQTQLDAALDEAERRGHAAAAGAAALDSAQREAEEMRAQGRAAAVQVWLGWRNRGYVQCHVIKGSQLLLFAIASDYLYILYTASPV